MDLPPSPLQYDTTDQDRMRRAISDADVLNIKSGQVLDKLLFRDTVTGHIKTVVVTSGALVIT